jgi:nucleotide-binding universal stress UspA family protein
LQLARRRARHAYLVTSSLPVVVGVDGSACARSAVEWAADEADRRGAVLRVVHANLWPTVRMPAGPYPIEHRQLTLEISRRLLFDALVAASERHPALTVTGDLVPTTPIDLMLAESRKAQLVVLGSRGYGGLAGMLLGSVALAVAGHGSCSLVVVRDDTPDAGLAARGPVVVGLDGSTRDDPALRFALEAADARHTSLIAVHAWTASDRAADQEAAADEQRRLLAERVAGWQPQFPDVKITSLVPVGRPAAALLRCAEAARLLVVGSRGRGGIGGLLLGSTSHSLLHRAPCPIAIVRDRD